uniref:Uncharacterized protein n=1 Tax=Palpitomonas bilix TaxID=652834 RepID=A0A7S3DDB8_9EUKA|mmetsp:Transcript_32647/g.84294  ORF Transcript_32647/g.84294 Transcript_32647/m.84294 type:complete len:922 (+) Transcript_32647:23-2788(+)
MADTASRHSVAVAVASFLLLSLPFCACVDYSYSIKTSDGDFYQLSAPSSTSYLNSSDGSSLTFASSWSHTTAADDSNTITIGPYTYYRSEFTLEAFVAARLSSPSAGEWTLRIDRVRLVAVVPRNGYLYVTLKVSSSSTPADVVIPGGFTPMNDVFVLAVNEGSGKVEGLFDSGDQSPHFVFVGSSVVAQYFPAGAGNRLYLAHLTSSLALVGTARPLPSGCTTAAGGVTAALGLSAALLYQCSSAFVVVDATTVTVQEEVTVSSTLGASIADYAVTSADGGGVALVVSFFSSSVNITNGVHSHTVSAPSGLSSNHALVYLPNVRDITINAYVGDSTPTLFFFPSTAALFLFGASSQALTVAGQSIAAGKFVWTQTVSGTTSTTTLAAYIGDGDVWSMSALSGGVALLSSCTNSFPFSGSTVQCPAVPSALSFTDAKAVFFAFIRSDGSAAFTPSPFIGSSSQFYTSFVETQPPTETTVDEERERYDESAPDYLGITAKFFGSATVAPSAAAVTSPVAPDSDFSLFTLVNGDGTIAYVKATNMSLWYAATPTLLSGGHATFFLTPSLTSAGDLRSDFSLPFGDVTVFFDLSYCNTTACIDAATNNGLSIARASLTVSPSGDLSSLTVIACEGSLLATAFEPNEYTVVPLAGGRAVVGTVASTGQAELTTTVTGSFYLSIASTSSPPTSFSSYSSFHVGSNRGMGLSFPSLSIPPSFSSSSPFASLLFFFAADGHLEEVRSIATNNLTFSSLSASSPGLLPGNVLVFQAEECGGIHVGDGKVPPTPFTVDSAAASCVRGGYKYAQTSFGWAVSEGGSTVTMAGLNAPVTSIFGLSSLLSTPTFAATSSYSPSSSSSASFIAVYPLSASLTVLEEAVVGAAVAVVGVAAVGAAVGVVVVKKRKGKKDEPLISSEGGRGGEDAA